MKRFVKIVLPAIAACSLVFVSFAPKSLASSKASDEQTLTQLENDWATALMKRDMAFLDRVEAPEYSFTAPDGSKMTRAESDTAIKDGVAVVKSFKIDDLKIQVIGDTAIVSGLETEVSSYKDKDTSGQYRYTDVFVKRKGAWRAVATHSTRVKKSE
jgi:ketosteroid isomerase-like protein